MTALHRVTGRSVRLVRTAIELAVLAAGFLLGGTVGVGTAVYALAIGPLAQFFLRLCAIPVPAPEVDRERRRRYSAPLAPPEDPCRGASCADAG
jgi:uncharacterized membrane protein YczE